MNILLSLSRAIDWINEQIGRLIMWFVLAAVLISAGNAVIRKTLNTSSNAWLEIQWYLFAVVFMMGVGYVLLHNAHVRIDFIASKFSKRTNAIVDIFAMVVFIIPLSVILINLSWPLFVNAWNSGEMSQNAGGLIRWPVYFLIPAGFSVLLAQAVSELIKRIAFLTGHRSEPFSHVEKKSETERLAEELAREAQAHDQVPAKAQS